MIEKKFQKEENKIKARAAVECSEVSISRIIAGKDHEIEKLKEEI